MSDDLTVPDVLADAMAATFKDADTGAKWLQARVPTFGGETPAALVRAGRVDEVVAALQASNSGLPT